MIEPILKRLEDLVAEEKRRSYESERYFSSPHEAYGVLLEEVEEHAEEAANVSAQIGVIWYRIKKDQRIGSMVTGDLRKFALKAAAEAIQVAAMCDKMVESESKWRFENGEV